MPRVHLFIPCFIDQLFPQVGIATVQILEALDCKIVYPDQQTCCGQPAFNTGYFPEAKVLAERFLTVFAGADYVVAPSGSCVAMVKNLYGYLKLSKRFQGRWKALQMRIFELSEFMVKILGVMSWEGVFRARVTYHDSCHLLRELGVSREPRQLIKSVKEVDFIEMFRSETCCGFGGTFAIKMAEISSEMAANKVRWIQETGAQYVIANDSSCLMHIDGFLKKHHFSVQTLHLAEFLWQARKNLAGSGH